MIMPRGQQLLLPANPLFIATSLTLALLLNMLQNMGLFGNAAGVPDFLALVLLFPCFYVIGSAANPGLAKAAIRQPVVEARKGYRIPVAATKP